MAAGTVAGVPAWTAAESSKREENAVKDLGSDVYAGRRYEALVPDTLDLAKRAELGISGIAGTIDPGPIGTCFSWFATPARRLIWHTTRPTAPATRFFGESLPMLRTMCGTDLHADVETAQRAAWFHASAATCTGIAMTRTVPGRPAIATKISTERPGPRIWPMWGPMPACCEPCWPGARCLATRPGISGFAIWCRGCGRIAVNRGDYSYYPDGGFGEPFNYPRSGWQKTDEPTSETEGGEGSVVAYHGHQIQALSRWYAMSGDKAALDLAGRVARFCMLPKFWGGLPNPDGEIGDLAWIREPLAGAAAIAHSEMGHWYSHFHARAVALRGVLEFGMTAGDQRALEFARGPTNTAGPWEFPASGGSTVTRQRRICARGVRWGTWWPWGFGCPTPGMGDYWDDVDAVTRNHLVEQQLTDAGQLAKVSAAAQECDLEKEAPHEGQVDTRDVIRRSLGNFAGSSAPDSIPKPWVMQCCTGNGTQGLYYAWEGTVRQSGDSAQVNLLLNRASGGLDVDSYLPYEGKVVIHNKKMARVSVRIPSWVRRREIRSRISGKEGHGLWVGNYLMFDGLRRGDKIELEFPVPEEHGALYGQLQNRDGADLHLHVPGQYAGGHLPPGRRSDQLWALSARPPESGQGASEEDSTVLYRTGRS